MSNGIDEPRRIKTLAEIEKEFYELPHPPIYWAPDETWEQAKQNEFEARYADQFPAPPKGATEP
jgi:hypothetical protein